MNMQNLVGQRQRPMNGMGRGVNQNNKQQEIIMEIIQLLQKGMTPEQLQKEGIPMELIQQALQIMQSQGQTAEAPMQVAMQNR